MKKHPVYGYLTESEFEAMQKAPSGHKNYWLKIAAKREQEAKKKKPNRTIFGEKL